MMLKTHAIITGKVKSNFNDLQVCSFTKNHHCLLVDWYVVVRLHRAEKFRGLIATSLEDD